MRRPGGIRRDDSRHSDAPCGGQVYGGVFVGCSKIMHLMKERVWQFPRFCNMMQPRYPSFRVLVQEAYRRADRL